MSSISFVGSNTHHHPSPDHRRRVVHLSDRTAEFQTVYLNMKSHTSYTTETSIPMPSAATLTVREQAARFNAFAQTVTQNMTSTHEMLENLTMLVRGGGSRGDAFDDASEEIQQLTSVVKQRLGHLHRDVEQLAVMMEQTREQVQGNSRQCSQHTNAVVSSLRMRLMSTTKEFKQVLSSRTDSLTGAQKRRSAYSYDRSAEGAASGPTEGDGEEHFGSHYFRHDATGAAGATTLSLVPQSAHSSLGYYRNRAAAVKEIEKTVHELSEMFQDFARLVVEQESLIRRIDDDVADALVDVEEGGNQLIVYLNKISSNRGLILKVFAVLFVFVLFFGFFIVR
eukprot:PhM_4_TR17227/c0_g1_i1/m.101380/K08490/STX5; syntaxin 5